MTDPENDISNGERTKQYTATLEHWESGLEHKEFDIEDGQSVNENENTGGNVYSGIFTLTWEDDNAISPDEFELTITTTGGSVKSYSPSRSVTSQSGNIQITVYITDPPPETYQFQANSTNDATSIVQDRFDIPDTSFAIDIVCNGDNSPLDLGNSVILENYYNGFTISSVTES